MVEPPRGRPAWHFTPRSGWVNDPLAVTWRDGRYHLFFQHVPVTTSWAPHCHWGHAVSPDLLSWEERSVALRPADDEVGCWSGCVVRPPDGQDLLLYTSVRDDDLERGRVRVARPRRTAVEETGGDPWDAWTPGEVVAEAPEGIGVVTFRDPFVVRDGDTWRMLVGGGLAPEDGGPGTACVFGYESRDLGEWRYTGLVAARHGAEREPEWTGTKWECPQLVRVGDVDVLVVSVCDDERLHHVVAAPGRFAGGRFTPSTPWQRLTYGVPYAATAFATEAGKPALLTWLRDVTDPAAGWAGALGLPLSLGVTDDRVVLDLLVDPGGSLAWDPDEAGITVLGADGSAVAALTAEPGTLVLTPAHGGHGLRVPRGRGPVRVLVDGPVLELVHDGRYGAVPLWPPTADGSQYQLLDCECAQAAHGVP